MDKRYTNSSGKIVGGLKDEIYYKKVIRSKHLMKIYNGYGIDKSIFDDLKSKGCKEIKILETDTGLVLKCPFKTFDDNKIISNFDGLQCFLPGKFWESYNPKQGKLI